ncbi:unnamed protein product [Ixodes pacificus]
MEENAIINGHIYPKHKERNTPCKQKKNGVYSLDQRRTSDTLRWIIVREFTLPRDF